MPFFGFRGLLVLLKDAAQVALDFRDKRFGFFKEGDRGESPEQPDRVSGWNEVGGRDQRIEGQKSSRIQRFRAFLRFSGQTPGVSLGTEGVHLILL